jgi:NADPH:quinone reductase
MTTRWVATAFGDLDVLELVDVVVPDPGPGEVTIAVRAAGMNPADYKRFAKGPANDPSALPHPVGFEVSGVLTALGPDTAIGSGGGAVGDEVLAFRIAGGYAEEVTVAASAVFAKPPSLDHPAAANLLLAGATGAEMLHVTAARAGDTVVVHGASGAVGVSVLQQARELGVRCVGTASERNFDLVRRFGGEPVAYGDGLADRLRAVAPGGYAAALDTVGTDEAVDVSLELVADRQRIVTIAAHARAQRAGFPAIGGMNPSSMVFRDEVRPRLIALAADGRLVVPVARTFPLAAAPEALALLRTGHPGGKLALVP